MNLPVGQEELSVPPLLSKERSLEEIKNCFERFSAEEGGMNQSFANSMRKYFL
jgi:hypothetical protein